jgi:hypothetical protein
MPASRKTVAVSGPRTACTAAGGCCGRNVGDSRPAPHTCERASAQWAILPMKTRLGASRTCSSQVAIDRLNSHDASIGDTASPTFGTRVNVFTRNGSAVPEVELEVSTMRPRRRSLDQALDPVERLVATKENER